jgi:aminoglycoside phosphotransferase (APT) family kinase protein
MVLTAPAGSPVLGGMDTPAGPPGLDPQRLRGYLADRRPDLADAPLVAALIAGGRSNLTYLVTAGDRRYVLRRPPLGHVLATAHDMTREYRVISALHGTAVPVPEPYLLCDDPEVLGAPFYLMRYMPGEIYRDRARTDALGEDGRRRLAEAMVDTLAALHGVDPRSVGLGDFGHPDGFLARQVRRWAGQLDRSRSRDLPGIDDLRERLAGSVPAGSGRAAIVHGDYRLDNLLVEAGDGPPRISAVLDWEMATLGEPLTDLGLLLTYWDAVGDPGVAGAGNPVADGLGAAAGFPSGRDLVARYAATAGLTDLPDLRWYTALGCFKLAVICEGIHYRYTLGQTVGAGFDRMGDLVLPLVRHGLAALDEED